MKYRGTLVVVSDMQKSKDFYEIILEQKVAVDLGEHITFESGLSLKESGAELMEEDALIYEQSNNAQLHFEVDDIEHWHTKIENTSEIEFIHNIKEYPWGQRVMRFYEFDGHIIEVTESMKSVVKRFLAEGLSVDETARRTMFPVDYVERCM